MKAVILAGGFGTRLSEETGVRPKPMVEIGGRPILWHIMKIYSAHGIDDFVICRGYKGYVLKEYFANYFLRIVGRHVRPGREQHHDALGERRVLAGHDRRHRATTTMTGGRLKRARAVPRRRRRSA